MSEHSARSEAEFVVRTQLRMALLCLFVAILGGAFAVLQYIPETSAWLNGLGLTLPVTRPIHTTFASLWIFGAGVAVVYHYLGQLGPGLSRADRVRFRVHTVLWVLAGIAAFGSLLFGVSSGREYVGFHPAISVVLLAGWLLFAWSFLRRLRESFWAKPVYVYMWTVGILFFIYNFVEQHAYLLPGVGLHPIRDLQLQWKSCGTLVGSFNFLVYGTLVYVTEKITGDKSYGQSRLAFSLFGIGCLNSFTNYVHHTYHVPQGELVKWIAFVVSMLEALILLRVMLDIGRGLSQRSGAPADARAATLFFQTAKYWTGLMIFLSLLISVPSWNSLVHGTRAITGHAMGTELGIDTMALFGATCFLLIDLRRGCAASLARLQTKSMMLCGWLLNLAVLILVLWLSVAGLVEGIYRYEGDPYPEWISWASFLFPILGGSVALGLLFLLFRFWGLSGTARPEPSAASEAQDALGSETGLAES